MILFHIYRRMQTPLVTRKREHIMRRLRSTPTAKQTCDYTRDPIAHEAKERPMNPWLS
ncbi:hypothetical protein AGR4C_pa70028 [Agrobacterium tumefaciens str. Kerr 14]|uniref:Uncharacterized protein n=1 Tax=Agrobacterium tumefaciens str. Kerr 14 TaxID=1183424 RepID=A0A1S7SDP2_AGRTU|nr:hypothetical protein AGR4C_pa70028 [Agrobacterium tumefaciens str. Kerr 14]